MAEQIPCTYDLVVAIANFDQLTNGSPGWEVVCPEIDRQEKTDKGNPTIGTDPPKGAAAVARRLHMELQRRKDNPAGKAGKAEKANHHLPSVISESVSGSDEKSTADLLQLDDPSKEDSTIFVAVVGLYNKGKTYVLNRIGKTNLREGAGHHTQGISMKTGFGPILSRFTLLDIAGFDAPVRVGEEQSEVFYKKYVDRFIEELALSLATAVVVVMNDITLADQLYLESVRSAMHSFKKEYTSSPARDHKIEEKFPDLIVIHNFSSTANLEECKQTFDDQVVRNYEGKWLEYSREQKFYYSEAIRGQKVGIRHVFIGRSLTEAERGAGKPMKEGDMYQVMLRHNTQVFEMIKTWLKGIANESRVEPLSTMVSVANGVLTSYFQNPPTAKLHTKEGKAYMGFDCNWDCDFKQPGVIVKPEVIMPGVLMLPKLGPNAATGVRLRNREDPGIAYDVLSTPSSVVILMDRIIPTPKVDYIPQEKKCIIKGEVHQPALYKKEGTAIELKKRFSGEFTIEVVLDNILTHGDAVALTFNKVIEDKTNNLFLVLFDKVKVRVGETPTEGTIDEIM
jgi:hypothetical protein